MKKMIQTIYDTKKNGLYRDRVQNFLIDKLKRTESMAESHYHPYYEFFYVTEGSCRIFLDHSLFFLNKGDMVILPPSALHRTQYETQVERVTVSFTDKYIEDIKPILGNSFFSEKVFAGKMTFSDDKKIKLESFFEELLAEDKFSDENSDACRKSLLMQILVMIARNIENRNETEQTVNETQMSIQRAAKFIFENFEKDITLQIAADVAGMRDTYFSRMFQEVTGYGFKEYLTNIRLQHSQEMLLSGKLTVTQIAIACGFSNSNYFGDAFKKKTGVSPREFRKNIQY